MRGSAVPIAAWQFRADPELADPRGAAIEFGNRLRNAVRIGHGLGVAPRWTIRSGRRGTLFASADDPTTARWIERQFAVVYCRSGWPRRVPDGGAPPVSERRIGARRVGWPAALIGPREVAPLFDRLAGAVASTAEGASVDLQTLPIRSPALSRWESPSPRAERSAARPVPTIPPERVAALYEPPARPCFWALRIVTSIERDTPASRSPTRFASACEAALRSSSGNGIRFHDPHGFRAVRPASFRVTEDEMLALLPTPGCPGSSGTSEPGAMARTLTLGRTPTGAAVGPVLEENQGRHLAVLGETGMGKSSLLVTIALRASRWGGVVLLDPVGETARAVRVELGPEATERTLWIDAGEDAPSLNALEGVAGTPGGDPVREERRLNDLVSALRRIRASRYTDSAYWGPRLEEVLVRALRAAAWLPHGTIADAHTLLATGARAPRPATPESQEAVRELAERIRDRPDDAEGARRLLFEVSRSSVLRRLVCDPRPSLSGAELVAPGRVVLVSGAAERVGESTARYFLAIYLAIVWSELLARPTGAKTFVVMDEAQWFAHDSLAEMLRLGRRRNAHAIVATQAIGSLAEGVREAVWTNVADFVTFRGSPEEAREFARVARGVSASDVLALPRGRALVLEGKGRSVHWIRAARRPFRRAGDPAGPAGVGPGPSGGIPGTARAGPQRADADDTALVVGWIRQRFPEGTLGEATIALADLRRELAVSPDVLRRVGSRLGRSGALRATEHRSGGTWWRIDPSRLGSTGAEPLGAPAEPARASQLL